VRIRYLISVILTAFSILAVISPFINDWLVESYVISEPPENLCHRLNLIVGENTCIKIINSVQKEIKENGVEGLREIPPATICQSINYDNDPRCYQSVRNVLAILPVN
jgi:hypothetical protein